MSSILFWDSTCQRPYDSQSIRTEATGGTEASLVRVADALDAHVIQHNRVQTSGRYGPPARIPGITQVVLNRDCGVYADARALYPNARFHLWVHDQLTQETKRGRRLAAAAAQLGSDSVGIVCVSDWQRLLLDRMLERLRLRDRVLTRTIYNPIDDSLEPDDTPVDRNKLVFFSASNRGLMYALDAFQELRRRMPELQLVLGNPGYKVSNTGKFEGVTDLGPQPQWRIHAEVRSALCTFFPNFVLPETFGLVFAESMAMGTPLLTHDAGAATEVIGDCEQVRPTAGRQRVYERAMRRVPAPLRGGPSRLAARLGMFDDYCERIRAWRDGARPRAAPDPRFRLSRVADRWRSLLSGA
ncbi:MAG: glycosyltransferase family 4 protein [Pseudoxanthomonas sp.]